MAYGVTAEDWLNMAKYGLHLVKVDGSFRAEKSDDFQILGALLGAS